MFNNLFQIVKTRKGECFPNFNISGGGVQPLCVVYIEIPNIEDLGEWVIRLQGFMASG